MIAVLGIVTTVTTLPIVGKETSDEVKESFEESNCVEIDLVPK